ncbi:hypothetical protein [Beggiatoa leptomitoformis]|uniref:Uncharacterized protein n=1 Tax=Beggiatoa leptomitoformis TaxID=288004 RepID=A0A2N9YAX2_9GAMM|nr:hypothetical protein [Beggiatoa leptomitoformis]ALG67009.2 hypothetical protein AL038_03855 [Beggiatoa leptomitoformis]AUI67615.2 hypothetical protein BLE401_02155 [Beggiatoa leptomitoformis]
MTLKRAITFSLLTAVPLLHTATSNATDPLAVEKFKAALSTCERSLQMETPKSQGSLRILQSLVNRYERDRDFSLKIEPTLKDSTTERYTGKYFVDQTFAQAYNLCEEQLSNKVGEGEALIAKQAEEIKQRSQQQQAVLAELLQKLDNAKAEVTKAVDQACMQHQHDPSNVTLVETYKTSKQAALTLYPNILKYTHEATILDPDTNEASKATRTVKAWFIYCDTLFNIETPTNVTPTTPVKTPPPATTVTPSVEPPKTPVSTTPPSTTPPPVTRHEEEGPTPPTPAVTPTTTSIPPAPTTAIPPATTVRPEIAPPTPTATETTGADTEATSSDDDEYNTLVKATTGDKQKVLKDEKRLPDFFDNEDGDIGAAKIWQFEKEDSSQCTTYQFNGDKIATSKKNKGECPSF